VISLCDGTKLLTDPFRISLSQQTDWQIFAAASTDDKKTQDMFIDDLVSYLKAGKVDAAFPEYVSVDRTPRLLILDKTR